MPTGPGSYGKKRGRPPKRREPPKRKVEQAKGLPTDRSMSIAYENLADRSMVTEQEMKTLRRKH